MFIRKFTLILSLCFMASLAHAAGLKLFEVPGEAGAPALRVAEWSPCTKSPQQVELGPFTLPAVRNCPVSGDRLPLIVISHGFGGTYLSHHDTAEALADAGFIVVAVNHPDDNALNPKRTEGLSAFVDRPQDVKRMVDFMLSASPDENNIDPARIGFYGFSRGGYTGLVLAGAEPDFRELRQYCQDPTGATCKRLDPKLVPTGPWVHDPRIKAYVIADPLSSVFETKGSLNAVSAPLQLWGSEHGGDGVAPEMVDAVARNLPVKPDFHNVANSGHFAFLATCPAKLIKSLPEICTDRPGFDRAAFHKEFNADAIAFFETHLARGAKP